MPRPVHSLLCACLACATLYLTTPPALSQPVVPPTEVRDDDAPENANAKVSGRVVNEAGQPVAGVLVAALGYETFTITEKPAGTRGAVTTDAEGRFTLEGLKAGDVVIGAARGRDFGMGATTTSATQPLALRLVRGVTPPPAPDWDAGFTFVEARVKNTLNPTVWRTALAQLIVHDPERGLKLANAPRAGSTDYMVAPLLLELIKQDPQQALQFGRERTKTLKDPQVRRNVELELALATAEADPQNARKIYDAYAANTDANELAGEHAADFAILAALSARLKNPDAEGWLQALTLAVRAMEAGNALGSVGRYSETLAEGNIAIAEAFIAGLSPAMQVRALEDVVPEVGKRDPAEALKMLAQMEELVAQLDRPAAEPPIGRTPPADSLSLAREGLARILLPTDPQKAYELASKMGENVNPNKASLMAQAAVKLPHEAARAALRQAFEVAQRDQTRKGPPAQVPFFRPVWMGTMAHVAAFAMSVDPQLGAEFFAAARAAFGPDAPQNDKNDVGIKRVNYAWFRAPFAPQESRLLLENEWQHQTSLLKNANAAPTQGNKVRGRQLSRLSRIAAAMSAVDMGRSATMLTELHALIGGGSERTGEMFSARLTIFYWLTASASQRAALTLSLVLDGD